MTPRVSVVVPTYNSVAFIDATMRSILAQTFTDFELVVSDHSSTDGTWEALQQFTEDPRVRLSRLALEVGRRRISTPSPTSRPASSSSWFAGMICSTRIAWQSSWRHWQRTRRR